MGTEDYNKHSVDATLARMEQRQIDDGMKIDGLGVKLDEALQRISVLERWRYYIVGVSTAAALGIKHLWDSFTRHT